MPDKKQPWLRCAAFDLETTDLAADRGVLLAAVIHEQGSDVEVYRQDKFNPEWHSNRLNDKSLCEAVAHRLAECDVLITYNGRNFDLPFLQTRLMAHGLPIFPLRKHVDCFLLARNKLRLSRYSLKALTDLFQLEERKTELWLSTWARAMLAGDVSAMDEIVEHCPTPDQRVLTADLRWVPAGDLRVGDALVGFDEYNTEGSGRKYRTSYVTDTHPSKALVYAVELDSGQVISVTGDHMWLAGTHRGAKGFRWIRTSNLQGIEVSKIIPTWQHDASWEGGYLSGLIDGEGTLGSHYNLSVGQRPGAVLERAKNLFAARGYSTSLRLVDSGTHPGGLGQQDCHTLHVRGSLANRLALLGSIRPARMLEKVSPNAFGRVERRCDNHLVKRVTPIGEQEITVLNTSTRTLFIEGYPMHNCVMDVACLWEVFGKLKDYSTVVNDRGSYW